VTPLVKQLYKLVPNAHESTWFDIGDLKGHAIELDAWTLVHLPFPDITVVGTDKGLPFAIHARSTTTNTTTVAVAGFALNNRFIPLPILAYGCSDTGDLQFWRKDGKDFDDVAQGMLGTLQMLVQSLDQGPRIAYRAQTLQTFTNQRKIAQGKPPAVSWHTISVHTSPPIPKPTPVNTHQEPRNAVRAHERRGHWRHLKSGKTVWVRHCTVGSIQQGIVLHDYKIA